MTLFACKYCNYTSKRGYNMSRHIHTQHNEPLTEDILDYHTDMYKNENEMNIMRTTELETMPEMTLDIIPYIKQDLETVTDDSAMMMKLSQLKSLMIEREYEKFIQYFYGGQIQYDNGIVYYQDKEIQLKDSEYYNLWYTPIYAYSLWLMKSMNNCKDNTVIIQATKTIATLANDRKDKSTIGKLIRRYISLVFQQDKSPTPGMKVSYI